MSSERLSIESAANTYPAQNVLLLIAPQPPPIGGATVLVQAVLNELSKQSSIKVITINTSPSSSHVNAKAGLIVERMRRLSYIIGIYLQNIKNSNAVLVFASNRSDFFIIYIPLMLLLARWYHKPIYIKPFGGALDMYLTAKRKPIRSYLISILNSVNGILAETQQLQTALIRLGCTNTYYVPGCRFVPQALPPRKTSSEELRLIFLSLIHRKKGVMILLDALSLLAGENSVKVSCDFYGPILEDREGFLHRLQATPGAHYCGEVEPHAVINLIATYDVLVLPTFAPTEGHPGAIIEAMQAGVPVISTRLRAIPELITHGENGLLVPAEDSHALAEAIRQIALDSSLRTRMGEANYRRGQEFRPEVVVTQILNIIFHRKELNKDT